MKKTCLTLIACLWVVVTLVAPAVARRESQQEPPGRDPAFEQEICDRLEAINSAAVPIFQEATRAMDAGDLESAKQGFERVLELAPDFSDALRRLSHVELQLGNVEAAVQRARQAHEADPESPYNRSALAFALLFTGATPPAAIWRTRCRSRCTRWPTRWRSVGWRAGTTRPGSSSTALTGSLCALRTAPRACKRSWPTGTRRWPTACITLEGLKHIVRQSLTFDALANAESKRAIEQDRGLQNLYNSACGNPARDTAGAGRAKCRRGDEAAHLSLR